jgi:hypothetical protein
MKRRYIVPAVVLAGVAPLQKETESPDCKNPPCATEPIVAKPKDEHVNEETPSFDDPKEWIVIMTSPVTHIRRTPENLKGAKERGLIFENGSLN